MTAGDLVLRAEHVCVEYAGPRPTRAVRDVTVELRRGEVLGIAGESGCGKSTLAYALTRMLRPPAELTRGSITYFPDGGTPVDLMTLDSESLRGYRWNKVSMVFQSAMNALNPVTSLGRQFDDIFEAHRPAMDRAARHQRARELLEMVGIDPARIRGFAARAIRRHAAAGHDRDGAGPAARGRNHGRAHDSARRRGAAGDPR